MGEFNKSSIRDHFPLITLDNLLKTLVLFQSFLATIVWFKVSYHKINLLVHINYIVSFNGTVLDHTLPKWLSALLNVG